MKKLETDWTLLIIYFFISAIIVIFLLAYMPISLLSDENQKNKFCEEKHMEHFTIKGEDYCNSQRFVCNKNTCIFLEKR